jgi:hypothetical protein
MKYAHDATANGWYMLDHSIVLWIDVIMLRLINVYGNSTEHIPSECLKKQVELFTEQALVSFLHAM